MRSNTLFSLVVTLCTIALTTASPLTINPSDDGSLYVCDGCNPVSNGAYVLVAGYIQGIVRFPTAQITNPISQAFLTVSPYGLPLFDLNVDVYGITDNSALIGASDANAGTFVGTVHLPSNLGYGQDAFFDVTAFLAAANTPYVGFNLRNTSTDVFSSIEYNYGHPSQLQVTLIPEPSTCALLVAAMAGLVLFRICVRQPEPK